MLTFSAGYALMALGSLTKGMQAPTYFVGAVVLYLVVMREWKRLFSLAHVLGIAVGAAVHLAWILPHAQVVGWGGAYAAWMGDVAMTHNSEMNRWQIGATLTHLVTYPFAVLAAVLPWSLMLLLYLRKDFRASIGAAKPMVLFATVCIAIACRRVGSRPADSCVTLPRCIRALPC